MSPRSKEGLVQRPFDAAKTPSDQEIEFKFLFSPGDLAQIERLPFLRAPLRQAVVQRSEALYFDTPSRDLWKRGFTLRLRGMGQNWIETVKREIPSAIRRGEWEHETDRTSPDFAWIGTTPLARLIDRSRIRAALRPAFEVHLERASFLFDANTGQIEGVIDQGHIEANGERLAICELELELKSGDRAALFEVARAAAAQGPLRLSLISKAERGFRLAEGSWGRSVKASRPDLDEEMTCEQAFQTISQTCLRDFMLNEAGFASCDGVEAVHQARISVRRLRAAMTLFRPVICDDSYARLRPELQWLGGLLGAARDLDVMRERLRLPAQDPLQTAMAQFAERIEGRRRAAHQAVRDGVGTERARVLFVDFVAWIEDGTWRRRPSDARDQALSSFIAARLKKRRKNLLRQGSGLAHLDEKARHQVRIEAKKFRYMADFIIDASCAAIARKPLRRLIGALEDLQTALGEIHDEETRAALVEEEVQLWREETKDLDEATVKAVRRWAAGESVAKDQLNKALHALSDLAEAKPF